ncbi:hypothetical protein KHA93_02915 [Bacillus sp. FJAT-49732]|uniref:Uncharacterized protein n=1 Tax=Lederbergia citrisecunda TaxID=2833583 RepID=A0A942TMH9_9BACI|nr:hypothetical protein [Lederbergia citrisecunda]MBS4198599.1 hypothetical protein [Lederbergia citrisecunda]
MKLSDKHVELIAKTTLEFWEKEKENQEKRKYDRRLRNIKLLLRNYRSFVKHTSDIKLDIQIIDERLELEYLDSDEFKLQSIKQSKEKTLAMIQFINKMLAVFKVMCEQSGKPEDVRRYDVIYYMYISEDKMTAEEISAMHNVAVRTIFLDIEKASKDLSVLVFGIDGVRFYK